MPWVQNPEYETLTGKPIVGVMLTPYGLIPIFEEHKPETDPGLPDDSLPEDAEEDDD